MCGGCQWSGVCVMYTVVVLEAVWMSMVGRVRVVYTVVVLEAVWMSVVGCACGVYSGCS